jgi:hypothetical protein
MPLAVDVFWSFRSPYSYLATPRLVALQRDWDVDVNVRVVLPIAVRIEGFFQRVNPLWPPYLMRDTTRIAEQLGLPYGWPYPDPIVQDYATREVAKEQPYIYRLTRLGVEAARRGRALPFITEISRVIFGGTHAWHEGTHLADATARAGSTSRRWTRRSRPIRRATTRRSRRTRRTSRPPATGACRRWCSRASRSSARTASISSSGGWSSTGSGGGRRDHRGRSAGRAIGRPCSRSAGRRSGRTPTTRGPRPRSTTRSRAA